jgi:cation/acetate symporter
MVWRKVHRPAVVAGMLAGLGVTLYYMVINAPGFRHFWGLAAGEGLWFGIQPLSAGVFGVPAGFLVMVVLTWVLPISWVVRSAPPASPRAKANSEYPGL